MSNGASADETGRAVFAGGCFWCMESEFEHMEGVLSAVSGYTGGSEANPTYEQVSAKKTTHVEAVEITYDPAKTSYIDLLKIYWGNIDPTDAGGQMNDRGPQYATVIYYSNDAEKKVAEESKLETEKKLGEKIVTRIEAIQEFYPAEEEHQNFYRTNADHYNAYVRGSQRKERLNKIWKKAE